MLATNHRIEHIRESLKADQVVLYYTGAFNGKSIRRGVKTIKEQFAHSPHIAARLFPIFIEMVHNISKYSNEHDQFGSKVGKGVGSVLIHREGSWVRILAGNRLPKSNVEKLKTQLAKINQIGRKELKALKRKLRAADDDSDNAGIGLLEIMLMARQPLTVASHEDMGLMYMTLSTKLDTQGNGTK